MNIVNRTKKPEPGVPPQAVVPQDMERLHPLIHAWRVADATDHDKRRLRIHSAFLTTLESRGHKAEIHCATIAGETLEFSLRDHLLRRVVPLTKKELKSPFRNPEVTTKRVDQSVGQLYLELKEPFSNRAHQWADRFGRPLEVQLGEAILAFEAIAVVVQTKRRQRDEEHALYQRKEERRKRRERLQANVDRAWDGFRNLASEWEEAARLRQFVDVIEERLSEHPSPPRRTKAWLEWVRAEIEALDPLSGDDDALFRRLPRLMRPRPMQWDFSWNIGSEDD